MKRLNARLQALAAFIEPGESVADIGADHGYLPLWLVQEGVSPFVVLTDVEAGPLEKTRESVDRWFSENDSNKALVSLRRGDGLSALNAGEVDAVVVAGMGGETIVSILDADISKSVSFGKYILQPRTKTNVLKEWILKNMWVIISETAALEKGRLCDIIVCKPGGKNDD